MAAVDYAVFILDDRVQGFSSVIASSVVAHGQVGRCSGSFVISVRKFGLRSLNKRKSD